MNNNKATVNLDEVLDLYGRASEVFDAGVLGEFIAKYPEHAKPLQRYAQVQLTFKQPTRAEVEAEELTDEEMLPQRSKLLQRMELLRGTASPQDVEDAARKLSAITGASGFADAAKAVFASAANGEDLLVLSVLESTSPVKGVPEWFNVSLSSYIGCSVAAMTQALAMKQQQHRSFQRFSAQDKPLASPPMTWEELVEDCIADEEVKKEILKRTEQS